MSSALKSVTAGELALRVLASRGSRAHFIYLVRPGEAGDASAEVDLELRTLDGELTLDTLHPPDAEGLLRGWAARKEDALLVEAEAFQEEDWRLLDRRRSDLARDGVTVFLIDASSLEALMRGAPNLASWMGGNAFAREAEEASDDGWRSQRLDALRAWSGLTDEAMLAEAAAGTLPRDPEYAEWLVLLGRGDLLDGG